MDKEIDVALTPEQIRARRLTGKYAGRYYYKGQVWLGPSNAIGHAPHGMVLVEPSPTSPGGLAPRHGGR